MKLPMLLPILFTVAALSAAAQYPNPYRMIDGWPQLPDGRPMGAVGGVTMDPDGQHLWAVVRCAATEPERFGNECLDSDLDPVIKFNMEGQVVESFGGGMFIWPHGIHVDKDGNVWVTDAVLASRTPEGKRGHQVIKFSAPADVVTVGNGDIFVADGHALDGNNRVVKFSKDGKYLMEWGKTGYGPGDFRTIHAIAVDSRGRVFIADRNNNRVQIFDQQGKHLATWTQFGRPSGIYFGPNDKIYVADSESDDVENPGWRVGIRVGDALTGWVDSFVQFPWANPNVTSGAGAEFVAVDGEGNMYAGEPFLRTVRKYVRVRP